jgi:integrase
MKRPAGDYLAESEIARLREAAWRLAEDDRTAYSNALRVDVALFTGLRIRELHALRVSDVRDDGTLNVRDGKGAKPRVAAFVDGLDESPTLALVRDYARRRHLHPDSLLWRSSGKAFYHWVVRRLGPAAGVQRRVFCLRGPRRPRGWLVHPHALRAAFVLICRRLPRSHGRDPVSWETICALGGWESVDTIRRHYYYADLPELLADVRAALPPAPRIPRPAWPSRWGAWRPHEPGLSGRPAGGG